MFSLIVTIISIALVAALALATLYYGGDIFNQGADRAQAAKIAAQGQQVMGALELYHAEHGVYPNTLADLVTAEYLKSIPVAFAPEVEAVQAALAAGVTWTLAAPGPPVIALTPVTLATCKAYNAAQFGIAQVLRAPHEAQLKSCYGASESTLTIIQAKSASDLVFVSNNAAAPLQIGSVVSTPLPAAASTDTSIHGWLVPGAPASAPVVSFLDASGTAPLASLAFADTNTGDTSAASTVTVKNTGTAALAFNATSASIAAPFAILANTCAGSLAPNASCTASVTFAPTAAQAYTGGAYALQMSAANLAIAGVPVTGAGIEATVARAQVQVTIVNGPLPGLEGLYAGFPAVTINFTNYQMLSGPAQGFTSRSSAWTTGYSVFYQSAYHNYGNPYMYPSNGELATVNAPWSQTIGPWNDSGEGTAEGPAVTDTLLYAGGEEYGNHLFEVALPPSGVVGGTWCLQLTKDPVAREAMFYPGYFAELVATTGSTAAAMQTMPWTATATLGACQ